MLNRKNITATYYYPTNCFIWIGSKATTDMAVNEIVADGYSGSLEREVLADQADIDRKLIEYWDLILKFKILIMLYQKS